MTKANGSSPMQPRAVLLSSRQITIVVDPTHHAMLNELAIINSVSVHDAATEYLSQAVRAAYQQLRAARFLHTVSHWFAW